MNIKYLQRKVDVSYQGHDLLQYIVDNGDVNCVYTDDVHFIELDKVYKKDGYDVVDYEIVKYWDFMFNFDYDKKVIKDAYLIIDDNVMCNISYFDSVNNCLPIGKMVYNHVKIRIVFRDMDTLSGHNKIIIRCLSGYFDKKINQCKHIVQ